VLQKKGRDVPSRKGKGLSPQEGNIFLSFSRISKRKYPRLNNVQKKIQLRIAISRYYLLKYTFKKMQRNGEKNKKYRKTIIKNSSSQDLKKS